MRFNWTKISNLLSGLGFFCLKNQPTKKTLLTCQNVYRTGNSDYFFLLYSDNGFGLFLNSCLTQLQRMTLESISVKPPMGLDYLRNAQ